MLVQTSLLREVTFTSADPMGAIYLLSWSNSNLCAFSTRILIAQLLFNFLGILRAGSNEGVNLGLFWSETMSKSLFTEEHT